MEYEFEITHKIWSYGPNFIRNSDFRIAQSEILIHVQDSRAILLTEFPLLASLICRGNSRLIQSLYLRHANR